MRELINDPFYEQITAYNRSIIDYCIVESDVPHQGYRSHKDAILFAICKVIERSIDYQLKAEVEYKRKGLEDIDEEPFPWSIDIGKAKAECINSDLFLYVPQDIEKDKNGKLCDEHLQYWHTFLKTPHKTGYGTEDFIKINNILFPNGTKALEVYEWTTDWSNYFDAGHEWWGAACWSVYDRSLNRYVVIMASTTD